MTVSTSSTASPANAVLSSALRREYVHKSAHSEVLLTGWRPVADDEFVVTAQWPRAHSFYSPGVAAGSPASRCTSPPPVTGSSSAPPRPASPTSPTPSTSGCAAATGTSTRWPPASSRSRRR
ncbi:AfsA-related hotdog domain-containing protein [Streptomyces sp. NPDC008265]|uniref:AfsA-related hotdog domain-containing protein n=1 Tax=Streptomyces sp. NPDC008265 TaxID=3364824 RepID=UPI0036E1E611